MHRRRMICNKQPLVRELFSVCLTGRKPISNCQLQENSNTQLCQTVAHFYFGGSPLDKRRNNFTTTFGSDCTGGCAGEEAGIEGARGGDGDEARGAKFVGDGARRDEEIEVGDGEREAFRERGGLGSGSSSISTCC